jgi:hypothetical protein
MISDIRSTSQIGGRIDRQSILNQRTAYVSTAKVEIPMSEDAAALERAQQRRQQIAALSMTGTPSSKPKRGWRATIGMFDNDPVAREISEEARNIRNSQRSG